MRGIAAAETMASNDELAKKVATLTIINEALKSENEEVRGVCRRGAHRPSALRSPLLPHA